MPRACRASTSCSSPISAGERLSALRRKVEIDCLPRGDVEPAFEVLGPMSGAARCAAWPRRCVAIASRSGSGQRIDRAAFETRLGDDRLAAHDVIAERQGDALQRLAGMTFEMIRPGDQKPQLDGLSGAIATPACVSASGPSAVGAKPRPARTAERQHGRVSVDRDRAVRRRKRQAPRLVPSGPVMPQRKPHAGRVEPRSHARNSGEAFMATRKHPPARSDEGRLSELCAPRAQRIRRKRLDGGAQCVLGRSVARAGTASSCSLCVRLSPPRPAIRSLRPADGMRS